MFITSKIKEMQRKRTFMTAPDAFIDDEEDCQPPPPKKQEIIEEEEPDILDEYNTMLKDIIQT